MTPDEVRQFLKEAFAAIIENMAAGEEDYAQYFSPDYVQHVDGKVLDYDGFVAHMAKQKSVLESTRVTFKRIIVEGDQAATVHMIHAVKKDGGVVEGQVNAFWQIKDRKIVLCDELTHMISGDEADRDLGSR